MDLYAANSETTRKRVKRYFGREATVLYPPVETERFAPAAVGDDYVVLSELMPHKRIDLAIAAFNELRLPLTVVGNGPDARRLRRMAGPTIRFTGRVSDAEAAALLSSARALVVTATEEFGIAAVEAQAAGRPVIALREGGVRETVIEGETGVFFDGAEPSALVAAVRGFDPDAIDPAACIANAERFDVAHFRHGLRALVERALEAERAAAPAPAPAPAASRCPSPRRRCPNRSPSSSRPGTASAGCRGCSRRCARRRSRRQEVIVVDNGSSDATLDWLRARGAGRARAGAGAQHGLRGRSEPRPARRADGARGAGEHRRRAGSRTGSS